MSSSDSKLKDSDLFYPCLRTRLVDNEPESKIDKTSRTFTANQVKEDVMKNLEMILNSSSRPSNEELGGNPSVVGSVLGFGLTDFCGTSHSVDYVEELRKRIYYQIATFEPRIKKETLEVNLVEEANSESKDLALLINGVIHIAPLNEEISFISRLDLELGRATVSENKK